jgi:hypothetical protein
MDFNTIAGIASIVGAALSLWTLIVATSAKKAAIAASKATQARGVESELEVACARADQLADLLRQGRNAEATLRCDDLITSLAELQQHRRLHLESKSHDQLQTVRVQALTVGQVIGAQPEDDHRGQVKTVQERIVIPLHTILGTVRYKVDEGRSK